MTRTIETATAVNKKTGQVEVFSVEAGDFGKGFTHRAVFGTGPKAGTYLARSEQAAVKRMRSNVQWWTNGAK